MKHFISSLAIGASLLAGVRCDKPESKANARHDQKPPPPPACIPGREYCIYPHPVESIESMGRRSFDETNAELMKLTGLEGIPAVHEYLVGKARERGDTHHPKFDVHSDDVKHFTFICDENARLRVKEVCSPSTYCREKYHIDVADAKLSKYPAVCAAMPIPKGEVSNVDIPGKMVGPLVRKAMDKFHRGNPREMRKIPGRMRFTGVKGLKKRRDFEKNWKRNVEELHGRVPEGGK